MPSWAHSQDPVSQPQTQIRTWGVSGLSAQGRQPTPGHFNILWEDKAPQIVKGRRGVRQRWRQSHRLQGPEAAGWGSVCGEAGPPPPHPAPGGCRDHLLPRAESSWQTQRAERASVGGGGSVGATVGSHPGTPQTADQGRGPTPGPCKHHSGAGPTLGPHRLPLIWVHPGTPQTTAQGRAPPHPVLSELLQLRVLTGTSETVR